jgi:hypothetical protein
MAVQQGADLEKLERLMGLQERWEANQARKSYLDAFARFKDEAVKIIKGRQVTDGPLKGKSYAELHDVVNAVTPALSRNGLSASWRVSKDEKDWIEVTCSVRHVEGHSEAVSFGGPPDAGGAKNAIQARASTLTYLERYTLKAILGLAEQYDDKDGNDPEPEFDITSWADAITACVDRAGLDKVKADLQATNKIPRRERENIVALWNARRKELAS